MWTISSEFVSSGCWIYTIEVYNVHTAGAVCMQSKCARPFVCVCVWILNSIFTLLLCFDSISSWPDDDDDGFMIIALYVESHTHTPARSHQLPSIWTTSQRSEHSQLSVCKRKCFVHLVNSMHTLYICTGGQREWRMKRNNIANSSGGGCRFCGRWCARNNNNHNGQKNICSSMRALINAFSSCISIE